MRVSLAGFSQACCVSLQGQNFARTDRHQIFFVRDSIFGKCRKTLPSQNKSLLVFSTHHDRSRLLFARRARGRAWPKRVTKIRFNDDRSLHNPLVLQRQTFSAPQAAASGPLPAAAAVGEGCERSAADPRVGGGRSPGCARTRAPSPARPLSFHARRQNSRPCGRLRVPDPGFAVFCLRDAPGFVCGGVCSCYAY